ncbi:MAG: hypothetical protein EHM58_10885 [Ignavibacteriae bacterium]|nr:MAG: hypothetical protein EHM58_10885 [Ignavibacteriota bacterium]
MRINKETLQGYILEEILAYLIKNAGYRLLTDPCQDPYELDRKGNGLVVKGRGSIHQADVLGQLEWIPTFVFPIRLFIEAKFRQEKTGIQAIRNAIGVLYDINQNFIKPKDKDIFRQRYSYNYAIFSTSGFTVNAIDLALAHNISLVDLSSTEYDELKQSISTASESIVNLNNNILTDVDEDNNELNINRSIYVKQIRDYIRSALDTDSFIRNAIININPTIDTNSKTILDSMVIIAQQYQELFIAMANGPFMLLLKANNIQSFKNYANNYPYHHVVITWNSESNNGQEWTIRPYNEPNAYKLSFKLPDKLAKWIFDKEGKPLSRALNIKENFFSSITIYRRENGRDLLYRLEYNPETTQEFIKRF